MVRDEQNRKAGKLLSWYKPLPRPTLNIINAGKSLDGISSVDETIAVIVWV